jgi:non-ribosomal peptide synthetase component F
LFDVLFVWQQSLSTESDTALDAQVVDSADDLEYKITLEFEPRKDHISLRATFDPSTIPERQIELLSRQIDEVVQLFLMDSDCAVTEVNRCFTTRSLSIANPNPYQQPIEHGPSHAVEQWASRDPQREAVSFGHIVDGVMVIKDVATYGMLNSRANQLARVLADYGVGHDQLVGIVMEKSVDLYTSILAVLKLGCGYLPLVPDTPTERMKTILGDAQVTVCISESSVSYSLRQNISVSVVDFDLTELSSYSEKNLKIPYKGRHLAYAVFTSGSTGTPKGVLVTQDNLMSNLEYLSSIYPVSATSRMLQSCSQ